MKTLIKRILVFVVISLALANQTSFGVEPTICAKGRDLVWEMYANRLAGCIHTDITDAHDSGGMILDYIATFGDNFLAAIEARCRLSSTRISIAKYNGGAQCYASPRYLIEFPESSINRVPVSITTAVARSYGIDPGADLYRQLKDTHHDVTNIFITACGFGPVYNGERGPKVDDFNIVPQGFMAHQYSPVGDNYFGGDVSIGLFENVGAVPAEPNPITANALAVQGLSFHDPLCCSGDVLRCRLLSSNNLGSFWIVAITQDKRNILISQVLIVNDEEEADAIANIFSTAPEGFAGILNGLERHSRTSLATGTDQLALQHTVRSLAAMSGNLVPSL